MRSTARRLASTLGNKSWRVLEGGPKRKKARNTIPAIESTARMRSNLSIIFLDS